MSLSPQQKKRKKQQRANVKVDSDLRFRNVGLTVRTTKTKSEKLKSTYSKHKNQRLEKSLDSSFFSKKIKTRIVEFLKVC